MPLRPTPLVWQPSSAASALHAVCLLSTPPQISDPELRRALADPALRWWQVLDEAGVDAHRFHHHCFAASARAATATDRFLQLLGHALEQAALEQTPPPDINSSRELIKTAGRRLCDALEHALPDLDRQLALRVRPLREQWEARGPGLQHSLQRHTTLSSPDSPTTVLLVHPLVGGAGAAHPPFAVVHLEAMLANPHAQLPEILRLAWLLAQLQNPACPRNRGATPAAGSATSAAALIPAVLEAAEHVELAYCDAAHIALALRNWHALPQWATSPAELERYAERLLAWWNRRDTSLPWETSVQQFAQELE